MINKTTIVIFFALAMLVLASLACSSEANMVDVPSTEEAGSDSSVAVVPEAVEAKYTETPAATEEATKVVSQEPTVAPTREPIAQPTRKPSETSTPTPIDPVGYGTVTTNANLRFGPSMDSEVIGGAVSGESLPIFARSADGWLLVDSSGQEWIGSTLVEFDFALTDIPIAGEDIQISTANELDQESHLTPTPTGAITSSDPSQCLGAEDQRDEEGRRLFSVLEILEVGYADGFVNVSGCTDLPDGTELGVTFDITGYQPDDTWIGVTEEAVVMNGLYSAKIEPPSIQQYQKGPYEVEVKLSPSQSEEVEAMIGEGGEQIVGDRVWELLTGDISMKNNTVVELPLQIQLPTYPKIDPNIYDVGSPERTMAEYLLAWQNQDWGTMASRTQMTWRDGIDDPATELMYMYDFKTLLGAEIVSGQTFSAEYLDELNSVFEDLGNSGSGREIELSGENFTTVPVVLHYALSPTWIKKVASQVVLVREDGPFSPSDNGYWGVNPISMLAEKDVSEVEEINDDSAQSDDLDTPRAIEANIYEEEDVSFGSTKRYSLFATVPFPITKDEVKGLCEDLVEDYKKQRSFNAVGVFFSDVQDRDFPMSIGKCEYAPNGQWGDAMDVRTGDYSTHEFYYIFTDKMDDPEEAVADRPTDKENEICDAWWERSDELLDQGIDGFESDEIVNREMGNIYSMSPEEIDEIVTKCLLWSY